MTLQPENVPGGYRDGRAALAGLVAISQREAVVQDALARTVHMVGELERRLNELKCARKDALSAIDLFADVAPSTLGVPTPPLQPETLDVEQSLTSIELEVQAFLAQGGTA